MYIMQIIHIMYNKHTYSYNICYYAKYCMYIHIVCKISSHVRSPHLYPSRMAALARLGLALMALWVQQRRSKHGALKALVVALETAVGIP